MSDNGNESAYPHTRHCSEAGHDWQETVPGMTKREAFAMAAMQGCLAYSYCNPASGNYHENSDPAGVAKSAIAYADALLAELDKQP